MSNPPTAAPRPRFGTIARATDYSGRSRSRLYQLAAKHTGLFVKDGASTLVDFTILDEILDRFPVAKIKDAGIEERKARPA